MVNFSGVPTVGAILVQLQSWWKLGQCPGIYRISHWQYLYFPMPSYPEIMIFRVITVLVKTRTVSRHIPDLHRQPTCDRLSKAAVYSISAGLQSWWKLGQCPGIYQISRRSWWEDGLPQRSIQKTAKWLRQFPSDVMNHAQISHYTRCNGLHDSSHKVEYFYFTSVPDFDIKTKRGDLTTV